MDWIDRTPDLDETLPDLPEPTDADLRAIEDFPIEIIANDDLYDLLCALLDDPPEPTAALRELMRREGQ